MNSFNKNKIKKMNNLLQSLRHNPVELHSVIDLTRKSVPEKVMIVVVDHDNDGKAHYICDFQPPEKAIAIFDQLSKSEFTGA